MILQGSRLLTGFINRVAVASLALAYLIGTPGPAAGFQEPGAKSTPDPYFQGSTNSLKIPVEPQRPQDTTPKLQPIAPKSNSWSPPLTPIPVAPTNQLPPQTELDSFNDLKLPPPRQAADAGQRVADGRNNDIGGGDFSLDPSTAKPLSSPSIIRRKPLDQPESQQPTQPISTTAETPAVSSNEPELEAFELGKVLALVGGEPIFVGDLMLEVNQMIEKFMPTAPRSVKTREAKKLIPRVLPKHVEAKILFQGIVQGMPAEFQENIDSVIEQAGEEFDNKALPGMMEAAGAKTTGEFDAQLRAQGSSLRKLRRSWSVEQLTRHFVGRKLSSVKPPTHQEMLKQYRANLFTYDIPAKARWEQVMVQFSKTASRAEAKRKIADMGNRIVNGANFQSIAKKESDGFRADEGGQHDWTTRGALVLNELDEAIFSLPIGKLSDIIETEQGFHIVRVIERNEKTRTPFLEAQVEIKEKLITEKRQAAFEELLTEFKRDIPVEYFDD